MTRITTTPAPPLLRVGLTGGIGSGKTTIAQIFEVLGIPVFYADQEAKRVMNEDPDLRAAIIERFGPEAYSAETGSLNRPWMAAQVFSNPAQRTPNRPGSAPTGFSHPPHLEPPNSLVQPATTRNGIQWMQSVAGH